MRCPKCGVECRVKVAEENGETKLLFFCRSKQCEKYDPEFRYPVAEMRVPKS